MLIHGTKGGSIFFHYTRAKDKARKADDQPSQIDALLKPKLIFRKLLMTDLPYFLYSILAFVRYPFYMLYMYMYFTCILLIHVDY